MSNFDYHFGCVNSGKPPQVDKDRALSKMVGHNYSLLQAVKNQLIPQDLVLLLVEMQSSCGGAYIADLVRMVQDGRMDNEQLKTNALLVLDHRRKFRERFGRHMRSKKKKAAPLLEDYREFKRLLERLKRGEDLRSGKDAAEEVTCAS